MQRIVYHPHITLTIMYKYSYFMMEKQLFDHFFYTISPLVLSIRRQLVMYSDLCPTSYRGQIVLGR